MYKIKLDKLEYKRLAWIAERYKYAQVLFDGLVQGDVTYWEWVPNVPLEFEIEEHKAWEWVDAVEAEDGWMTCAGGTLLEKLVALYEEIV